MGALAQSIGNSLGWQESSLRRYWQRFLDGFSNCGGRQGDAQHRQALWIERLDEYWRAWEHEAGSAEQALGDQETVAQLIAAVGKTAKDPKVHAALRIPADDVLTTEVLLPQAATQNMREVLGFEMQRRTPFNAEQVFYDHRILEAKTDNGQVRVQLFVVPKAKIQAQITALQEGGLTLDGIVVSGQEHSVNLLPTDQRRARKSRIGINFVLLTLLLGLLYLALWLPIQKQADVLAEQKQQLTALRTQAKDVTGLRAQLKTHRSSGRFLVDMRAFKPRMMIMLTEITKRVPDNTWVQTFSYKKGVVELRGESKEAYGLIALLEESPLFKDVKFKSTVTNNTRTSSERFHLQMMPEKNLNRLSAKGGV